LARIHPCGSVLISYRLQPKIHLGNFSNFLASLFSLLPLKMDSDEIVGSEPPQPDKPEDLDEK
jgi:hypothetical protein